MILLKRLHLLEKWNKLHGKHVICLNNEKSSLNYLPCKHIILLLNKMSQANKCESQMNFSLQLLLLICPANLSDVCPLHWNAALKTWEAYPGTSASILPQFSFSEHPHDTQSTVHTAWRRTTSNHIPSVTEVWQPDTWTGRTKREENSCLSFEI